MGSAHSIVSTEAAVCTHFCAIAIISSSISDPTAGVASEGGSWELVHQGLTPGLFKFESTARNH